MPLAQKELKLYTAVEGKPDKLMTVDDICEYLNVKKSYIYQLTAQKRIPHIKLVKEIRFRKVDIDSWLESQEVRCGNKQKNKQGVRGLVGGHILQGKEV